jgi:hypothetical protein
VIDNSRACRRCGTPIALIDGVWVSTDYTSTAGGLSYCPPDPDADRVGKHMPRRVDSPHGPDLEAR